MIYSNVFGHNIIMLFNRSSALLLLAIVAISSIQASPLQNSWLSTESDPMSISRALSTALTELPFDLKDGPSEQRKFDVNIGHHYVLPFIVSTVYDEYLFTLEEKATIVEFISQSSLNFLVDLKIKGDELVHLLNTLIVEKDVTTLQRLSRMTDSKHQKRFNHLLSVVEVDQLNIETVESLPKKSHQNINIWRDILKKTQMVEVLSAFHGTVSSLSELWREFYWVLNL